MKRKMKKTLEQEMEKHLSLYGVVYFVIEPTGELGLIDGTGCTVSDYEVSKRLNKYIFYSSISLLTFAAKK